METEVRQPAAPTERVDKSPETKELEGNNSSSTIAEAVESTVSDCKSPSPTETQTAGSESSIPRDIPTEVIGEKESSKENCNVAVDEHNAPDDTLENTQADEASASVEEEDGHGNNLSPPLENSNVGGEEAVEAMDDSGAHSSENHVSAERHKQAESVEADGQEGNNSSAAPEANPSDLMDVDDGPRCSQKNDDSQKSCKNEDMDTSSVNPQSFPSEESSPAKTPTEVMSGDCGSEVNSSKPTAEENEDPVTLPRRNVETEKSSEGDKAQGDVKSQSDGSGDTKSSEGEKSTAPDKQPCPNEKTELIKADNTEIKAQPNGCQSETSSRTAIKKSPEAKDVATSDNGDNKVKSTMENKQQAEEEKPKMKVTIRADPPKDGAASPSTLTCQTCGFSGGAERAFSEHLMCHLMLRPYQCLQCKQCFVNRRETSLHVHRSHDGAKMSCALVTPRALRRAKALIKEALAAGAITFLARVGSKVPLDKDPDKVAPGNTESQSDEEKKKQNSPETASGCSSRTVTGSNVKETNNVSQTVPHTDAENNLNQVADTINKTSSEAVKTVNGKPIRSGDVEGTDGKPSSTGEDRPSVGFSRLREVLTSSSTTEPGQTVSGGNESKSRQAGPRIVNSFTLSDGHKEGTLRGDDTGASTDQSTGNQRVVGDASDPNFVSGPARTDGEEQAAEIMSFLGPEQPIFRSANNTSPFLAPPPLIPAPSADNCEGSQERDQYPPPPQLSSAPAPSSTSDTPTPKKSTATEGKKNPDFFVCAFDCLFSSMSTEEFREHTTNFHSNETYFPCFYCGHRSGDEDGLVRHVTNHAQSHNKASSLYVCGHDGCRFGTNMVGDYITHIRSTHPQVSQPLCFACGDRFPDLAALQSHVEENVINIVNCPHCACKATERRPLLSHIASEHPGKARMVSVAKQLICHDRKLNDYACSMNSFREMPPPTLTPAPSLTPGSGSVVDQILRRQEIGASSAGKKRGTTLSDILSARTGDAGSPRSMTPDLSKVKDEVEDMEEELPVNFGVDGDDDDDCFGLSRSAAQRGIADDANNYIVDEHGVRRRIYVPMSERQAENFRCRICTFIARDLKRKHCHERSHGMPPTRKDRFKCIFCPQGFDSEMKFRLHITCHPGDIQFLIYRCKKCEFDTNKRETIVRHITCNRDRKHRGTGPVEAQYTTVSRCLESRVLVCERCDYMTRHKIHMAIHYQRAHSILRDKSDFSIPGLNPIDRPISSFDEDKDDEEEELAGMDGGLGISTSFGVSGACSTPSPSSQHSSGSAVMSRAGGFKPSPSPPAASSTPTILSTPTYEFSRPSGGGGIGSKRSRDRSRHNPDQPVMTVAQISERNDLFTRLVAQHAALSIDPVLENQVRKFKCPICQYLLPKAADLKNHVKRHSEVGQITLTMYRCKYCSCMSTAPTLLYEHLAEKHPGKPIALVKKIVAIDTNEVDKSFAETAMEVSMDQLELELRQEIMAALNSQLDGVGEEKADGEVTKRVRYEQLFVIPEGGERFEVALQCPKCPFKSHDKAEVIGHVNGLHPEVKVIGSDDDVDKLAGEAKDEPDLGAGASDGDEGENANRSDLSDVVPSQEDVLILPDEPFFKEAALCSRCDFTTMLRKDMVTHLQRHHPDISVMGRNSYPMQVATLDHRSGSRPKPAPKGFDSCVVGSGSLDAKIGRLYENYGTQMRCLICGTERPKKFFIHVHILRHLNIYLWKCAFCAHRGLQKYKMVDHIKKIHPGRAMSVRYLRVNVEAKVAQFLEQFDAMTNDVHDLGHGFKPDNFTLGADEGSGSSSPSGKFPGGGEDEGAGRILSPLYTLGSESLDEKVRCLYEIADGPHFKCLACPNQFQRRFAVHRHLVMVHLKINLLKCAHCPKESVERHLLVDHSLACHQNLPITIVPLGMDLTQVVSDFLTRMANGELADNSLEEQEDIKNILSGLAANGGNTSSRPTYKRTPSPSSKSSRSKGTFGKSPRYRLGGSGGRAGGGGGGIKKPASVVDPDVIMLGREALDKELRCLYQVTNNGALRCLVCRWEFPRKYPLHRHMMLKHLRLMLVGCPYCPFEGVEKYNVSSHIKEEHKDQPINIKYVSPDVGARVQEFIDDMAVTGGSRFGGDLIKKPPSSRDRAGGSGAKLAKALLKVKVEKKEEEEEEDKASAENDDKEKEDGDEEREEGGKSPGCGGGSLVVAMFGKKKKAASLAEDDGTVKVKAEVEDDEYNNALASTAASSNHEDDGFDDEDAANYDNAGAQEGEDEEETPNDDENPTENGVPASSEMESYQPGSFRFPSGGKPKALDVITSIKVLKSREGGLLKFYCELCKFTSLHRSNVVRHIYKIHERYRTHTCPVCSYQTLSLLLMQDHMERSHPGVQYTEDSFSFTPPRSKPRSSGAPSSTLSSPSRPAPNPLSAQRRRQEMLASLKLPEKPSKSSRGPKQFACAYCHYETDTQDDILQHTKDMHSKGEDASSSAAVKSPTTPTPTLTSPSRAMAGGGSSKACWDGSKKATKRRIGATSNPTLGAPARKKRFIFEKGDELIHCLTCATRETSMGRMEEHCAYEHPGAAMNVKRIPAWRFVCRSCVVKTMATSKMKYHLNRHVNYRPYTCGSCGAFFPSPDQCRRHSRSQGHDDQPVYARVAKKEQRVEELLKEARQLAMTVQEAAILDPDFDISQTDKFISQFQDSRTTLKRSAPLGSAKRFREMEAEEEEEEPGENGQGGGTEEKGTEKKIRSPPKKTSRVYHSTGLSGLLENQPAENVNIRCHTCKDFTAPTVYEVREHHRSAHPGRKFLWQDMQRGFVCDSSGEALADFDSVPIDSSDVGYTTKMTLGAGASPMRFKCKSCDFSSCVIQAMKSHLKSHQPKGFMCPYCSRAFSGKEKLSRHQQCLHPASPLWTIHLRRFSAERASSTAASTGATPSASVHATRGRSFDSRSPPFKKKQTAKRTGPKASPGHNYGLGEDEELTLVCASCEFATGSLYHFRLHLANQHGDTFAKHVTREAAPGEAMDGDAKDGDDADKALVVDMLPEAKIVRVSEEELEKYGIKLSEVEEEGIKLSELEEEADGGVGDEEQKKEEDGEEEVHDAGALVDTTDPDYEEGDTSVLEDDLVNEEEEEEEEEESVNAEEEEEMEEAEGEESEVDEDNIERNAVDQENEEGEEIEKDESKLEEGEGDMEDEDDLLEDSDNKEGEVPEDEEEEESPEALARKFGLVSDEETSKTDTVILQFEGLRTPAGGPGDPSLSSAALGTTEDLRERKDATLLSAQIDPDDDKDGSNDDDDDENDDEDEEGDPVTFDTDITLASPLPMISLEDGVALSPVNMGLSGQAAGSDAEMLLDV